MQATAPAAAAVGDIANDQDVTQVVDQIEQRIATLQLKQAASGKGFTIAYALSTNDQDATIAMVDIVLMTVINFLTRTPMSFKRELERVNEAVGKLTEALSTEGADVDAALAEFKDKVAVNLDVR